MTGVVVPVAPIVVCLRVCSDAGKRQAALVIEIALGAMALILVWLAVRAILDREWRRPRRRRW